MPFGILVTQLRADLSALDKDLEAAKRKVLKFHSDVAKSSVSLSGPVAGGARIRVVSGNVETSSRRVESDRARASRERAAAQRKAEQESSKAFVQERRERIFLNKEDERTGKQTKQRIEKQRREAARSFNEERKERLFLNNLDEQRDKETKRRIESQRKDTERSFDEERKLVGFLNSEDEKGDTRRKKQIADRQKENAKAFEQERKDRLFLNQLDDKRFAKEKKDLAEIAKQRETTNAKVRQQALQSFRAQSGLGAVRPSFGSGAFFISPQHLRNLDVANAKWKQQHQEIAKAGSLTHRLGLLVGGGLVKGLQSAASQTRMMLGHFGLISGAGLVGAMGALVVSGIELNKLFRQQQFAIATSLGLTTKLVDEKGKEVDAQTSFNENIKESIRLQALARKEAAQSILTARQLIGAFSASIGLGRAAGMTEEQTLDITKRISQQAVMMGLRDERQLTQETRALLTGEGLEAASVGRVLGITSKEQLQKVIESGKIYEFLKDRLSGAEAATKKFSTEYEALTNMFVNKTEELCKQATEKLFEKLTKKLGDLNKFFDAKRIDEWAEAISEAIIEFTDRLEDLARSPAWKTIAEGFRVFFSDPERAGERALARMHARRSPEENALEAATLRRKALERELTLAEQRLVTGRSATPLVAGAGFSLESPAARARREDPKALVRVFEEKKRLVAKAVAEEEAAQQKVSEAHVRNEIKKVQATEERYKREARNRPDNAQKASKEALFIARMEKELADDVIDKINETADVRELRIKQNVKSEKERDRLLAMVRKRRAEDTFNALEKERLRVKKQQADMLQDTRASLEAEFEETLRVIREERLAREDQRKLELAAQVDYQRKLRDQRDEERLARQSFVAETTGDEILAIINAANRAKQARREFLERSIMDETTRIKEFARTQVMIDADKEKKIRDKRREMVDQTRDLEKKFRDEQASILKSRMQMEDAILDLQKKTARELRDLMRERIEAERELKRAQIDRVMAVQRVGEAATTLPAGRVGGIGRTSVLRPEVPGFEGERRGLQTEAESLLGQFRVGEQLQALFSRQHGRDLGAVMAQRRMRELSEQLAQPGGAAAVTETLGGLGVRTGTGFLQTARGIETRTTALGEREAEAQRQADIEQQRRAREDINKGIEEAQRRLQEIREREEEARKTFQDTIRDLQEKFNQELRSAAENIRSLGTDFNKLGETVRQNTQSFDLGLKPILNEIATIIAKLRGTSAEGEFVPTQQFVFGADSIKVTTNDPEEFIRKLERDARRIAPARR